MKNAVYLFKIAFLMCLWSSQVYSQGHESHEHGHDTHHQHHGEKNTSHDAHVHGMAELTLVIEDNVLEMEFVSPAANIVSFEHKAKSTRERQLVSDAKTFLESPRVLFKFNGTECSIKTSDVDMSSVNADQHKEHKHSGHHHHHDEEEKQETSTHSDVKATYKYECKDTKKLASVSLDLFRKFPGVEKVNAMWVTEVAQGAVLLSAENNAVLVR